MKKYNIIKVVTEGYGKKYLKPVLKDGVIDKDLSFWIERSRGEKATIFLDDIIIKEVQKIAEEKMSGNLKHLMVGWKNSKKKEIIYHSK